MIRSIKATSRAVCGTSKNIAMAEVRDGLSLRGIWYRLPGSELKAKTGLAKTRKHSAELCELWF